MSGHLEKLGILGAGVLGGQIAWHSAFRGKSVAIYDLHEEALERCRVAQLGYADIYAKEFGATAAQLDQTRARLRYTNDLGNAVADADLVIEAVPEIVEVKIDLYKRLAGLLPEYSLLATNSSTLLPSQFAEHTGRPEKYCALHFANMIWAFNVVEIMAHSGTSEGTLASITSFAIEIGMVPLPLQKEKNGYVLNSWLVPLLNAAVTLVANGVSTPEDVDRSYLIVNRGCRIGPCGIIDVIGMGTAYNVLSFWGGVNQDRQMQQNANFIKERFIDKGLMGLQSLHGFYRYPDPSYQSPSFVDVPNLSDVGDLVARMGV